MDTNRFTNFHHERVDSQLYFDGLMSVCIVCGVCKRVFLTVMCERAKVEARVFRAMASESQTGVARNIIALWLNCSVIVIARSKF